jgi:tetratricopeptide (TPR) repeat protein
MIARVSSISVVLLFLIAKANCQSRIESLENLLRSQISDSIRTKTLIDLSSEYQYKDFKKSIDFIDQALQLASLKEWTWAKAMAYEQKSFLNTINGDFNAAIISDQELLKLSVLDHDSSQIAKSLNFLGFDYEQLGEFDEAYYYFTQSYQMALSLHDSIKIAKSLINLASIYKELGQYNEALNYLDQCKKLFERMRDNSLQLYILDEAGDIYQRQNELDKAEESLILSLQLSKKFNARLLEPKVLQRLAQVSLKRNEYKKSFSYYDSAMRIYKKLNNQFGISEIKLGRGKIFLKQEKFDSALVETELSQTIARKIHAKKAEADCLAQLAELAELKNDFKKALSYYKSSKLLNDSIMSEETLAKTFQNQLRWKPIEPS